MLLVGSKDPQVGRSLTQSLADNTPEAVPPWQCAGAIVHTLFFRYFVLILHVLEADMGFLLPETFFFGAVASGVGHSMD